MQHCVLKFLVFASLLRFVQLSDWLDVFTTAPTSTIEDTATSTTVFPATGTTASPPVRCGTIGRSCCIRIHSEITLTGLLEGTDSRTIDVGSCINVCAGSIQALCNLTECRGSCYARKTEYDTFHRKHGPPVVVETVKSCDCSFKENCRRIRKSVLFFKGTPNETLIDVGTCTTPSCSTGQCRATKTSKVMLEGLGCMEKIAQCSCTADCYRVSSYKYLLSSNGSWTAVDVGQCVGSCSDSSRQCAAVETLWQNETSVYTIQQCGCQQSHDVLDLK